MSNNRITNLLPDKSNEDPQPGPFQVVLPVGGNDRKTGVFVNGLTGAQAVTVKLMVNPRKNEFSLENGDNYDSNDLMQIRTDGADIQFTVDDNYKSFEVPGIYVLTVPSGATVSIGAFK